MAKMRYDSAGNPMGESSIPRTLEQQERKSRGLVYDPVTIGRERWERDQAGSVGNAFGDFVGHAINSVTMDFYNAPIAAFNLVKPIVNNPVSSPDYLESLVKNPLKTIEPFAKLNPIAQEVFQVPYSREIYSNVMQSDTANAIASQVISGQASYPNFSYPDYPNFSYPDYPEMPNLQFGYSDFLKFAPSFSDPFGELTDEEFKAKQSYNYTDSPSDGKLSGFLPVILISILLLGVLKI